MTATLPGTAPKGCPPLGGVSAGIMAHNEAANIGNAVQTILGQEPEVAHIAELIVVASGCTDRTLPIVAGIARRDPRVRLVVQERREGKASAINQFIAAARSPILLMAGADVVLRDGAVDALLAHFRDPRVGMVGAHPIPLNDEETFLGHAVHLLWRVHDRVARDAPKLGEVVAFRNVVPSIPMDTPVDEISIQALISQLGYRLVYEPGAIVFNRGPTTLADFLKQRRRIYAGHLRIERQQGYAAPTMSTLRVARALLGTGAFDSPRAAVWTAGAVALEAAGRALGHYDHARRRSHHIWQMVDTTKTDIDVSRVERHETVLVFRICDFAELQLELGVRAAGLLAQQVAHLMRRMLDPSASVSIQNSGTIIVVLPLAREEAERSAQQLRAVVEREPVRFNSHREGMSIKLACGIITFQHTGDAEALSIPAAV